MAEERIPDEPDGVCDGLLSYAQRLRRLRVLWQTLAVPGLLYRSLLLPSQYRIQQLFETDMVKDIDYDTP